jgi:type II secretion system protein C
MKHPFWIINSFFFVLTLIVLLFVWFSGVKIPHSYDTEPTISDYEVTIGELDINIRKIYEDDLFDTFIKELPTPPAIIRHEAPIPQPPREQQVFVAKKPEPKFLDPLDITLKGVIIVGTNESKNRAIIADNKTLIESTYKTGDSLEDAQLIRIFGKKILFLRSNGQQEILYLHEEDAKQDPAYLMEKDWSQIIKKNNSNSYSINTTRFIQKITNLARFIDLLNISTAYKDGQNMGCQIGNIAPGSLGHALGLQKNDIILSINNIVTTSTDDRIDAYKYVISLMDGDTINAEIQRNNQNITIMYILKKPSITIKTDEENIKNNMKTDHFLSTMKQKNRYDRKMMLTHGKKPEM